MQASMIGRELKHDSTLSPLARAYCRLFGVPIIGLRIRWRWVRRHLPESATQVLDAGCGRGVISRALAACFPAARINAIDVDAERQVINADIARAAGIQNCTFTTGDVLALEDVDRYDFIVSVDNLEHVEDDRGVMAGFFKALQPGGTLLVHVPHYYRHWPVFQRVENFDVPGHVRPGYHAAELTERLGDAGFVVESVRFSYGWMETIANNLSYAITGAQERNQILYALAFPWLNLIARLGHQRAPSFGAGLLAIARKPEQGKKVVLEPVHLSDKSAEELNALDET